MNGLTIPLLLCFVPQGTTAAECTTYKETAIQCKFTKDLSSTKTGFTVHYQNNGKTELLIDCVWLQDKLECIDQEGFECKQPVSDVAEISVPSRFKSRPGSYICRPEGYTNEDSKPCQFVKNQHKYQTELVQDSVNKNHTDQKAEEEISTTTIIAITGPVLGLVPITIVTVMLVKRWKKRSSSKRISDKSCQSSKKDITDEESNLTDVSTPLSSIDSGEVKALVTSDQFKQSQQFEFDSS